MDRIEKTRIKYRWPAVFAGAAIAVASTVGFIEHAESVSQEQLRIDAKCENVTEVVRKAECIDDATRTKERMDMDAMLPGMGMFLLVSAGMGLSVAGMMGFQENRALRTSQPPLPISTV